MQTHTLDIAGHQLTVRSPAAPGYVQGLAADIDARVAAARDAGAGHVGSVLLAALGLADELARAKEKLAGLDAVAQRLTAAADAAERD